MSEERTPSLSVPATRFATLVAILAELVGVMVLLGWKFDIVVLKSILPGWFPMKANFAVALILLGIALWLTVRSCKYSQHAALFTLLARFCVSLAGLIGALTLGEYIFGWDFGIDQWLFREPVGAVGTSHPGRMVPEAALCLVLLATALLIIGGSRKTRRTMVVSISIGMLVATLGLEAMLSHLTPGLGVHGWFGLPIMAMHAAMMLATLGAAVIAISWQPELMQWSLSRRITAAFACGLVVLVFIGFNTSRSQFLMKETSNKIAYYEEVRVNIRNILIEIIDAQAHVRGYVITGDEQFMTHYLEAKANSNEKLDVLRKLISDNRPQQQDLALIEASVNTEFQWFQHAIVAERNNTSKAARDKMVVYGEDLLNNHRVTFEQLRNDNQQVIEQLKREAESVSRLQNITITTGTLSSLIIFLIVLFRLNVAVSERKRSEGEYRTLIQTSLDGFWINDFSGRILDVNKAYCQMLGYEREELLRMSIPDIEASEAPEQTAARIQKIFQTGGDRFQTRHRRKDGAIIDMEVSVQYNAELGERIFAFLRDITERKQAEAVLRESKHRLDEAQHIGKLGFLDWNLITNEIELSDETLQMYGLDPARNIIGVSEIIKLVHPDDADLAVKSLNNAIEGKGKHDVEHRIVRSDGKLIYVHTNAEIFRDANGKAIRVLGTVQDITERKLAEQKIHQLNVELEQRVVERTAQLELAIADLEGFSYSVSHDLRTPLRAIDGFSNILLEDYSDKLDAEGQRLLKVVRSNTIRMSTLIDDILQFSRAGRVDIKKSIVNMDSLAHQVIDELNLLDKGRTTDISIENLLPSEGDQAMLHQVLENLIANAIKFSGKVESPKVHIGSHRQDHEIIYFVQDNGTGFDMKYADKLFGVFQRLHSINEFEGTGIGLAIAKRIIYRHGGRIWAEAEVGKGATFYFSIPDKEHAHE